MHTSTDETAPLTAINRPNREIRDYRSVDDDAARRVDERVFPGVSKDIVSQLRRLPQAEQPSTVIDYTDIAGTEEDHGILVFFKAHSP
jgi:hypothetical protein